MYCQTLIMKAIDVVETSGITEEAFAAAVQVEASLMAGVYPD